MRLPGGEAGRDRPVGYLIRLGEVEVEVPPGFDAQELLGVLCVVREVAG